MSCYHGEVINLSLRDVTMLNKFKIIDIKKRFLGLVKIYTVELPSEKIEEIAKHFQSNMSTNLKKEWYITFHNRERIIILGSVFPVKLHHGLGHLPVCAC